MRGRRVLRRAVPGRRRLARGGVRARAPRRHRPALAEGDEGLAPLPTPAVCSRLATRKVWLCTSYIQLPHSACKRLAIARKRLVSTLEL